MLSLPYIYSETASREIKHFHSTIINIVIRYKWEQCCPGVSSHRLYMFVLLSHVFIRWSDVFNDVDRTSFYRYHIRKKCPWYNSTLHSFKLVLGIAKKCPSIVIVVVDRHLEEPPFVLLLLSTYTYLLSIIR